LILKSFLVGTNAAGIRQFDLFTECFVKVSSVEQYLEVGENIIEWEIELEPGGYFVRSNEEVNVENLGGKGPLLLSYTPSTEFPYLDELSMISLEKSSTGTERYYHYFDWKVGSVESKECDGGYYETQLKSVVAVGDEARKELKYNTIVKEELNLEWEGNHTFSIYDSRGVMIASEEFRDIGLFVMSGMSSGVYYLECEGGVFKLIKL